MDENNENVYEKADGTEYEYGYYQEMQKEHVFIGDYPFETIMDGLNKQFENYVALEDTTDYVAQFFSQLEISHNALTDTEDDSQLEDMREYLDSYQSTFIEKVYELIKTRLRISIPALEEGGDSLNIEDIQYILHRVYNFFILNAKENFKRVISSDVLSKLSPYLLKEDDERYFERMRAIVGRYSPRITAITPTDFLKCCNADEITSLYDEGLVAGNFLRSYGPRLYQNEEFEMELIRDITLAATLTNSLKEDQPE